VYVMNDYTTAKRETKKAAKLWYIFVPVWFVASIVVISFADAIESDTT